MVRWVKVWKIFWSMSVQLNFRYVGPLAWEGLCKTGRRQSPINIDTKSEGKRIPWTNFQMNEQYLRETKHEFFGQNNGHSGIIHYERNFQDNSTEWICSSFIAQFELTRNISSLYSDMRICQGGLKDCYRFGQFHFHWDETDRDGSEHTIDGQRFPLEMHVVHYKEKYSSLADALASDELDAAAVMAVFFQVISGQILLERCFK